MAEIRDNCVDDDGNGNTDRADPMCTAPADSGMPSTGLGDTSEGKAAVKCQTAIEKASTAFVTKKLGRLDKCVDSALACVQLKNGDAACLAKATAACATLVAGISDDETKLEAAIEKGCDDSNGKGVPIADIRARIGLGYSAEEPLCNLTIASTSDLATCVKQRQERGAERVLAVAAPRAHEMLALLGVDGQFPA